MTRVVAALDHCGDRIRDVHADADRLCAALYRGERHDELLQGLRHLMIDRATYCFDVNEVEQRVRELTIFFGDQDHVGRMLTRLLTPCSNRSTTQVRGRSQ